MAGFCLEMAGDPSNAALQYRLADKLSTETAVDDQTGRLALRPPAAGTNEVEQVTPAGPELSLPAEPTNAVITNAVITNAVETNAVETTQPPIVWDRGKRPAELVCFVMLGRSPTGEQVQHQVRTYDAGVFAEISANGRVLGRSYPLADTADLAFTTWQKEIVRKLLKTGARLVTKETIARQLEEQNELLGLLARLILIGVLERPDVRRWETLPRWLQVARVACPPELKEFEVTVRTQNGGAAGTWHVDHPIQHNGSIFVSFCRDIQAR